MAVYGRDCIHDGAPGSFGDALFLQRMLKTRIPLSMWDVATTRRPMRSSGAQRPAWMGRAYRVIGA
jgi:hypothetical protein